jgi:hypothetical protein
MLSRCCAKVPEARIAIERGSSCGAKVALGDQPGESGIESCRRVGKAKYGVSNEQDGGINRVVCRALGSRRGEIVGDGNRRASQG